MSNLIQDLGLLEVFAAQAPTDIPEWFGNGEEEPLPTVPDPEYALRQVLGYEELPAVDQAMLLEWMRDGTWDLADRLKPFGQAARDIVNQFITRRRTARVDRESGRYFRWRWHYAQRMMESRPANPAAVDIEIVPDA